MKRSKSDVTFFLSMKIFFLALCFSPCVVMAGDFNVRLGGDQLRTRIVIESSKPLSGEVLLSRTDQDTLTIGLNKAGLEKTLKGKGLGLVESWRLEKAGGSVRLRLNFEGHAKIFRKFQLPPADGRSQYRYVVDVVPQNSDPYGVTQKPTRITQITKPNNVGIGVTKDRLRKTIVIDAGHGGHDPGASGAGSNEKHITLAVALALKDKLEKSGGYKVILTRDGDHYVDLSQRVKVARTADADLFISLHADSGDKNPNVRGASIYTLSESGTERAAKKALAKGDWALADQSSDQMVNRILIDLNQRATKNRSAIFAQLVLDNIRAETVLLKSTHRKAGFMVLLAPDVPAILLEMGFLTNPQDEAQLNSQAYRLRMASNLAKAIDQYFSAEIRQASFGF